MKLLTVPPVFNQPFSGEKNGNQYGSHSMGHQLLLWPCLFCLHLHQLSSTTYPVVVKMGHAHSGMGKVSPSRVYMHVYIVHVWALYVVNCTSVYSIHNSNLMMHSGCLHLIGFCIFIFSWFSTHIILMQSASFVCPVTVLVYQAYGCVYMSIFYVPGSWGPVCFSSSWFCLFLCSEQICTF